MRRLWPAREAGQVDYEELRAAVLADGTLPDSVAATRFCRRGLAGLIVWPAADPVFAGEVLGGSRPPWTPHSDPRQVALAEGFGLLLAAPVLATAHQRVSR